jgi:hypothetical protein
MEDIVRNIEMWDEEIHEIKVDGVKEGFSYRLNQVLSIYENGRGNPPTKRVISNILRRRIDGEVVYQVYTTNEEKEDYKITKVFINLPVYITFKS